MVQILSGIFRSRRLVTPKGEATRPTTSQLRQAVFNICQHEIEGADFLDICAGSGGMGCEALSRGANHVTFIDSGQPAIKAIRENVKSLGVENKTSLLTAPALVALKKLKTPFDIIYFDPPYSTKDKQSTLTSEVLSYLDTSALLKSSTLLFLEESSYCTLPKLQTLTLKNERRFGSSHLYLFNPIVL